MSIFVRVSSRKIKGFSRALGSTANIVRLQSSKDAPFGILLCNEESDIEVPILSVISVIVHEVLVDTLIK